MKTLKMVGVFALLIMNSSCDLSEHDPSFFVYNLALNFQDASGNNLAEGIELEEWIPNDISMEDAQSGSVKRDLYLLDIIISIPCWNWDNEIYNTPARPGYTPDVNRPRLGIQRHHNGDYYLTNNFVLPVDGCPGQKILTYKLKCPYVFGDEKIHEFVTYWDIPKGASSNNRYAKCSRIEFDGNEITPTLIDTHTLANAAVIILK